MPITKSASKSLRQNLRRHRENVRRQKKIKEIQKQVVRLANDKKIKEAEALLSQYQKAIDKAVKTNVLQKNTASRKKSRLSLWLKNFDQKTAKENR